MSEIEILSENWNKIEEAVKEEFPGIIYGFGYGSGVSAQLNYDYENSFPLIDLIFVVENQRKWHKENFRRNRHHYSGIPYFLGANYISIVNNSIFPITFFPDVQLRNSGSMIKYGVVEAETVIRDLENWEIMTIAGRMQKPIKEIYTEDSEIKREILELKEKNLEMGYFYSKSNLKKCQNSDPKFDEIMLELISLSYKGDLRMSLKAESENKIEKIYRGSEKEFKDLYSKFENYENGHFPKLMCDAKLKNINKRSSFRMGVGQILLGGLKKNLNYLGRKLAKGMLKGKGV